MTNKKFELVNILQLCMVGAMIIHLVLLGIFTVISHDVVWLISVYLVLMIIYILSAFQVLPFKKKNIIIVFKVIKFIFIFSLLLFSWGIMLSQVIHSIFSAVFIHISFPIMVIFSIIIYTAELSSQNKNLRGENTAGGYMANKKFEPVNILQFCMAVAMIIHLLLLGFFTDMSHGVVYLLPDHFILMTIYTLSAFQVSLFKKKNIIIVFKVIKFIFIFSLLYFSWLASMLQYVYHIQYINISFAILAIFSIIIFSAELISSKNKKLQGEKNE